MRRKVGHGRARTDRVGFHFKVTPPEELKPKLWAKAPFDVKASALE